jgi:hypothetical protein
MVPALEGWEALVEQSPFNGMTDSWQPIEYAPQLQRCFGTDKL